jgi:hypothetical protein
VKIPVEFGLLVAVQFSKTSQLGQLVHVGNVTLPKACRPKVLSGSARQLFLLDRDQGCQDGCFRVGGSDLGAQLATLSVFLPAACFRFASNSVDVSERLLSCSTTLYCDSGMPPNRRNSIPPEVFTLSRSRGVLRLGRQLSVHLEVEELSPLQHVSA